MASSATRIDMKITSRQASLQKYFYERNPSYEKDLKTDQVLILSQEIPLAVFRPHRHKDVGFLP